jgi:hypothetical protein
MRRLWLAERLKSKPGSKAFPMTVVSVDLGRTAPRANAN